MKTHSCKAAAAMLLLALAACSQPDTGSAARAQAGPSAKTAGNTTGPEQQLGTLRFTPCSLTAQNSGTTLEAMCGRFEVAENPQQPQGRKIALNMAWLPAKGSSDRVDDPVFFLAGGPGQSAVDGYPTLDPAFRLLREHRDVILVDQRGTGKSNLLQCELSDTNDTDVADTVARTEACRDQLATHADLRFYTTTDAVRDLDAVRAAIGADRINLVGVSYGTRVAQQYALRHPEHTRSLVLDSVVPNTLVLGNIWARNLDDALALQFGRCSKDSACRAKVGDPRKELDKLLATLRAKPPTVQYRDATSGELKTETLNPEFVVGLVRMFAYMPAAASVLPVLIHDANQGRYDGMMALSQMLFDSLRDGMAIGMQYSVVCSEDAGRIKSEASDEGTVLGRLLTNSMEAACKVWPKGELPADFNQPLRGAIPTLVLEGEFDPVTPPRYGEEVVKTLDNARLLVLRGQGHNVIGAGCMPKLVDEFLDKTQPKALDAKCLDRLPYTPPFTSFNGWEP